MRPEKNKVICRISGGIGNQLFTYAAARRLAWVNNAELVIDDTSGFLYDKLYHQIYQLDHFKIHGRKATRAELLQPFARLRRYIKRKYNYRRIFEDRNYIRQSGVEFEPRLLSFRPHGTIYLEGYWQSEDYFSDIASTIHTELQIIPPGDAVNLNMAAKISDSIAVAVHVRFFDAPNENDINNAPGDYYTKAVERMEKLVSNAHYFIFSDRPSDARLKINIPDSRITVVAHNQGDTNAYADLWLMTLCKHFIIANSTFSWWGAWLAPHKDKHIIVPGFVKLTGKSSWGFKGLLPEEWIKI